MKLSRPVYRLKHRAKKLARAEDIPLNAALDRLAIQEGFTSWSALAAAVPAVRSAADIHHKLAPGDLLLSAARPGQGKTLLALELALAAMRAGHRAFFFSLEYTDLDMVSRFEALGADVASFRDRFTFDDSDRISADYVTTRLAGAPAGTLAVIDYLQLLDQRRENPPLEAQIRALRAHARRHGHVFVFIAQVDRRFEAADRAFPTFADLRLPNALDLGLFDKACFLNAGAVWYAEAV
ncbi:DNA helicase [Martelella soudanensis]|uniref:DNA helicase n=1 Tax=unclassified Martelella TaxID=2629616 RepID=UPI0015DDC6CD|nr:MULTISPECIES: DNA helicase [unclassified Martelella]